jgi:hypothetical protein
MYCLTHSYSLAKRPKRLQRVLGPVQAGGLKLWDGDRIRDEVGFYASIRPRDIPPGGLYAGTPGVDTMDQSHTGVSREV